MARQVLVLMLTVLVSGGLALLPVTRAEAATATWTGQGLTGNWSNSQNWQNGLLPVDGSVVTFPGGITNNQTLDDLPVTPGSLDVTGGNYQITLTSPATALTLSGSTPITVGGTQAASLWLDIPVTLSAPAATLVTNGAGSSVGLNRQVTAGSLTFSGAGAFRLYSANSYAGGSVVGNAAGTDSPAVWAETAGALGSGAVTVQGNGEVTLSAPGGSVWTNDFSLSGNTTYGSLTTFPGSGYAPYTQTISGRVTIAGDTAISLTWERGATTVSNSTADLVITGGLAGPGALTVASDGMTPSTLTISGSADSTNTGPITATTPLRFENTGGTLASAATSYTVSSLYLASSGQIPSTSSLTVSGPMTASGQTVSDLTMEGGTVTGPITLTGSLTNPRGGEIDGLYLPGSGRTLDIAASAYSTPGQIWPDLTLKGVTADAQWTKTGAGVLGLTGAVGTGSILVEQGTLWLSSCGCGTIDVPITVEPGATVGGAGGGSTTIRVVGGTVYPDGTLDVGGLYMDAHSTFKESATVGGWGEIVSSGPVSLGSAAIVLEPNPNPPAGSVTTLIHTTSGLGVWGYFAGVPEYGGVWPYNSTQNGFSILYDDNGGADVTATYHYFTPYVTVQPASTSAMTYQPGQTLTFTVQVLPTASNPPPPAVGGQVVAWDGYAPIPGVAPATVTSGVATVSITLRSWPHQIWFLYTGDPNWMPAASYETLFVPSTMPSGKVGHAGGGYGPGITLSPTAPSRGVARDVPIAAPAPRPPAETERPAPTQPAAAQPAGPAGAAPQHPATGSVADGGTAAVGPIPTPMTGGAVWQLLLLPLGFALIDFAAAGRRRRA